MKERRAEQVPQETVISFLDEPEPFEESLGDPMLLTTFLASGIVNPYGPTLDAIAALGPFKPGKRLPLLHLSLNPFQQTIEKIGEILVGQSWQPSQLIRMTFEFSIPNCPTLLLPSIHLDEEDALAVHAEFLARFPGARDVLDSVQKHPGDPWNRIKADMDQVRQKVGRSKIESGRPPLNKDEAIKLAALLLDGENMTMELRAFLTAWDGAIDYQREGGSTKLADAAMDLETICVFLGTLGTTCRVPGMTPGDPDE